MFPWNKKPKAVIPMTPPAPVVDWKAKHDELHNKYTAAVSLAGEQAQHDSVAIKSLQTELDALSRRHEATLAAVGEQAQKDNAIIGRLKRELNEVRDALSRSSSDLERSRETIALLNQKGEELLDQRDALNQKGEELLKQGEALKGQLDTARGTILRQSQDYDMLVAENAGRNGAYDRLAKLSRQAIYLLNHPGGMHLPWRAQREKLVTQFKEMGIMEEPSSHD